VLLFLSAKLYIEEIRIKALYIKQLYIKELHIKEPPSKIYLLGIQQMSIINSHGVDIYYELHGEAERTLIFAHGMGGNGAIWFNQIAEFCQDYQVLVFDHRYFARSPCSKDQFDPAKFPDDIIKIMDKEGIDSAVFVCQSMGGWTGSQMAILYPDRVDGLVMSHTPGIFYHPEVKNEQQVDALVSGIGDVYTSPALAADFPEKNMTATILYAQISGFNNIENSVIPRKIAEAEIGINTDSIGGYNIPTLFITGELDNLFPAAYIQKLSTCVPEAEFSNLGQVGHSSYFESPIAFNSELRSFLKTYEL